MSDLCVGLSVVTESAPFSNSQSSVLEVFKAGGFEAKGSNNEIDLREIWQALKRLKKLSGIVAENIIALTGAITVYQRAFNPVFRGSFAVLIADHISNNSLKRSTKAADGTLCEQLALNTINNNIPTLMEVLQSPLLLGPIAKNSILMKNFSLIELTSPR